MIDNLYKVYNGASLTFIPGMEKPLMPGEQRVLTHRQYLKAQDVLRKINLKVEVISNTGGDQ